MAKVSTNLNFRRKILKKFFITFFAVIFFFVVSLSLVLAGLAIFGEYSITPNILGDSGLMEVFTPTKERTNALIIGIDDENALADAIMLVTFDSTTERIDIISIPRDTKVVMPIDRRNSLIEQGRWVPSDGVMKMNAVHAHAGMELGTTYMKMQVEDLFGIEIDYYARIDLDAFRYIIDEIGGVEFDVPQRMFYHDPVDGLLIDLQPGFQTLNGAQAEGLVRYRSSYAEADLQRVRVQQEFVTALITQVISRDNLINNATAIVSAMLQYVDTNFGITDVPKYIRYVDVIREENIYSHTIPGSIKYISGISYVIVDDEALEEMINNIFFNGDTYSSSVKNISVLNGGNITGAAANTASLLEREGFNIVNVDNYEGSQKPYTRIIVREEGLGEDISVLLPGSTIILDENIERDQDIIVILGTD